MKLRWPSVHKDFTVSWTNTYKELQTLKHEIEAIQYWQFLARLEKARKGLLDGRNIKYQLTKIEEINGELDEISQRLYEKTPEYTYRPLFC